MKRSAWAMSLLAVVLWAGTGVLAQGQDKGGGGKERVKERPAPTGKAAQNLPPTDPMVEKNAPKGKAAKDAQNAMKGAEDQGKKMGTVAGEAVEKGKGKGKGAEQQAKAFQKQLQQEQAKHMERVARLNRIRELALKQGDTTTVARVDKLIAKEQEVFGRKQVRIQGQPRATLPPTGAEKTAPPTTVGPDEAAKGKAMPPAPAEKAGKNDKGAVKKPEAKPQEAPKP